MTKETAEATSILVDRLTKPVLAMMFCAAICWMGIRTVVNISADQFVGLVMMVAGFYFGRATAPVEPPRPPGVVTTATVPGGATAAVETKP